LPGWGKGLEAEKAAPFGALLRLCEQQGHFRCQGSHVAGWDDGIPMRVDPRKDTGALFRVGQEPVEITWLR
jgi:hypothetical protein